MFLRRLYNAFEGRMPSYRGQMVQVVRPALRSVTHRPIYRGVPFAVPMSVWMRGMASPASCNGSVSKGTIKRRQAALFAAGLARKEALACGEVVVVLAMWPEEAALTAQVRLRQMACARQARRRAKTHAAETTTGGQNGRLGIINDPPPLSNRQSAQLKCISQGCHAIDLPTEDQIFGATGPLPGWQCRPSAAAQAAPMSPDEIGAVEAEWLGPVEPAASPKPEGLQEKFNSIPFHLASSCDRSSADLPDAAPNGMESRFCAPKPQNAAKPPAGGVVESRGRQIEAAGEAPGQAPEPDKQLKLNANAFAMVMALKAKFGGRTDAEVDAAAEATLTNRSRPDPRPKPEARPVPVLPANQDRPLWAPRPPEHHGDYVGCDAVAPGGAWHGRHNIRPLAPKGQLADAAWVEAYLRPLGVQVNGRVFEQTGVGRRYVQVACSVFYCQDKAGTANPAGRILHGALCLEDAGITKNGFWAYQGEQTEFGRLRMAARSPGISDDSWFQELAQMPMGRTFDGGLCQRARNFTNSEETDALRD